MFNLRDNVLETRKLSFHSLSVKLVSAIWNQSLLRGSVQNLRSIGRQPHEQFLYSLYFSAVDKCRLRILQTFIKSRGDFYGVGSFFNDKVVRLLSFLYPPSWMDEAHALSGK